MLTTASSLSVAIFSIVTLTLTLGKLPQCPSKYHLPHLNHHLLVTPQFRHGVSIQWVIYFSNKWFLWKHSNMVQIVHSSSPIPFDLFGGSRQLQCFFYLASFIIYTQLFCWSSMERTVACLYSRIPFFFIESEQSGTMNVIVHQSLQVNIKVRVALVMTVFLYWLLPFGSWEFPFFVIV